MKCKIETQKKNGCMVNCDAAFTHCQKTLETFSFFSFFFERRGSSLTKFVLHFLCTAAAASRALLSRVSLLKLKTRNQKLCVWLSEDGTHLSAIYA